MRLILTASALWLSIVPAGAANEPVPPEARAAAADATVSASVETDANAIGQASDGSPGASAEAEASGETICGLIEAAAAANEIPVEFFTRLIWQESSFRPDVVSPKGAQGVAQFMPGTAVERGLVDPFDPRQAIPASAGFLRDLAAEFGNLGLAAAAYNAGPRRVANWLAGQVVLPFETESYVAAITGRAAADWASVELTKAAQDIESGDTPDERSCVELAALLGTGDAGLGALGVPTAWGPWGVQVAGNFSQSRALAGYGALQRKFSAVLGGKAPMVVSERMRSRGSRPFFNVRVPANSRAEADGVCAELRAAGGSCVVLKN